MTAIFAQTSNGVYESGNPLEQGCKLVAAIYVVLLVLWFLRGLLRAVVVLWDDHKRAGSE